MVIRSYQPISWLLVPAHRRTEHMRQQLRAEADAQHGLVLAQGSFDGLSSVRQVRVPVLVFHVHRSAEHDQPAIAVDIRLRIRVALEIVEADAVPARADPRIERAQRLGGNVLENHQSGHARQR